MVDPRTEQRSAERSRIYLSGHSPGYVDLSLPFFLGCPRGKNVWRLGSGRRYAHSHGWDLWAYAGTPMRTFSARFYFSESSKIRCKGLAFGVANMSDSASTSVQASPASVVSAPAIGAIKSPRHQNQVKPVNWCLVFSGWRLAGLLFAVGSGSPPLISPILASSPVNRCRCAEPTPDTQHPTDNPQPLSESSW